MSERFYEVVYTVSSRSRHGAMQKVIGIKCPWCESVTEAYAWSLAGSGKRCNGNNCTAVHHYRPAVSRLPDRLPEARFWLLRGLRYRPPRRHT